ncbi:MAG: HD domain-containing phosphohydrolase [Terriglobia bacterium]|jgi:response regulator RpfG family c-di-GMP phosphodiesterase
MAEGERARILLVDDEVQVLEGLQRHLRKDYDVTVSTEPKEALKLVAAGGAFAVVVSDLRMPGMDGVSLLYCIRQASPDTVRVLLTGNADMEGAIAAVNEGNIFRFLIKPCPTGMLLRALEASVEQYRLITAERVLLEQTLRGSLKTLTDVLALVNPVAFGRALRARKIVGELASRGKVVDPWQVEIAAMLTQIGWVTLPAETVGKLYQGEALSESEQTLVGNLPAVIEQLLANIPRLEAVREILRYQDKHFDGQGAPPDPVCGDAIPWGARALKAVSDFDALESRGLSVELALDTLRARAGWYDPAILEALAKLRAEKGREAEVMQIPFHAVQPGMIFAEDVKTPTGLLLIARGQEVTPSFVDRIKNLALNTKISGHVQVILPRPPSPPAAP